MTVLPPPGLRRWQADDAPALLAAWTDPEIARWNPVPSDPSLAVARRWIEHEPGRWASGRAHDLVVVDDAHGVVGEVGFHGADRLELGFWLLPVGRGRCMARTAIDLATDWALTIVGVPQVWARTDLDNTAAQRTLLGAGFRRRGTVDGVAVFDRTAGSTSPGCAE